MIMVRHQAIGGNTQIPLLRGILEKIDKPDIIIGVGKNGFTPSAAIQDMIPCIGVFYPQGSGHA